MRNCARSNIASVYRLQTFTVIYANIIHNKSTAALYAIYTSATLFQNVAHLRLF